MINKKIILSSVIAGVVSLSASQHVTAALPNFQQGNQVKLEPVCAMNVFQQMANVRGVGLREVTIQDVYNFAQVNKKYRDVTYASKINVLPIRARARVGGHACRCFPNMEVHVFYNENDPMLWTSKQVKEANIVLGQIEDLHYDLGYTDKQINTFRLTYSLKSKINEARYEYPMDYDEAQKRVTRYGKCYDKMTFTNVSMYGSGWSKIKCVDNPNEIKEGQSQVHYTKKDGINRFYLDRAETQEIFIKELKGYYFSECRPHADLSMLDHLQSLGNRFFVNTTNLAYVTTVRLPRNLREIPKECFKDCYYLSSINIDRITVFRQDAFFDCLRLPLQNDTLKNAEIIESGTFLGVAELRVLNLDLRKLTSLGKRAFSGINWQGATLSENMLDEVPAFAFDDPRGIYYNGRIEITYVDANGQQVFQETGADIVRKEKEARYRLINNIPN